MRPLLQEKLEDTIPVIAEPRYEIFSVSTIGNYKLQTNKVGEWYTNRTLNWIKHDFTQILNAGFNRKMFTVASLEVSVLHLNNYYIVIIIFCAWYKTTNIKCVVGKYDFSLFPKIKSDHPNRFGGVHYFVAS